MHEKPFVGLKSNLWERRHRYTEDLAKISLLSSESKILRSLQNHRMTSLAHQHSKISNNAKTQKKILICKFSFVYNFLIQNGAK